METNLPREVVLSVLGLEVLNGVSSDLLLVEPDLGVGAGIGKKVLREVLGELPDLLVDVRHRGVGGTLDVSV